MTRILLLITSGTVFITCDNQITNTGSDFHKAVGDMKVPFLVFLKNHKTSRRLTSFFR